MPSRSSFWLVLILVVLNLVQASITQLIGDEALYWMHGQLPDWGYKDHPPMIGMLTALGYSLFPGELGVRLLVVFCNALTIWLLALLVSPVHSRRFIILVLSIPVLHIYGFIATPDAPLLLFTVLYVYLFRNFLADQGWRETWLLGLCMAALVWSKYHGILVIGLTLLPQRKLWFHPRFWIAALFGVLLFVPHIWWQIVNDLPTIKFHLVDRSGEFKLAHVSEFLLGQIGVFNPVVLLLSLIVMWRTKPQDAFERSLRWLYVGMMVLFLFSSLRGRVEAHWTAAATAAMVIVICRHAAAALDTAFIRYSLVFFIGLIAAGRLALIVDFLPPLHKEFHRNKARMSALYDLANGMPVCFMNSYQDPSLYMFYTPGTAHAITNTSGGKNQYDWWNYSDSIHEKEFLYVASFDAAGFKLVEHRGFQFRIRKYEHLPLMHRLYVRTQDWYHEIAPGDSLILPATIINRNTYGIRLSDSLHTYEWRMFVEFKKENQYVVPARLIGLPEVLNPGDSAGCAVAFRAPVKEGSFRGALAVSVDTLPFTYQSNWLRLIVRN